MYKHTFSTFLALITFSLFPITAQAQDIDSKAMAAAVSGLELRGIGPAMMGGRIADIAVSPTDRSIWYVAVGSGGLWKTTNRGITWTPVFDGQPSYSIGTVALDPNNPDIVWVGTGENVSGRHVAWGDGVYRSADGGATWQQMGLATSEHIGRILIDPRDSNTVFVAAEGPLWSSGGERGVFKTTDGGKTWKQVLQIDEHTGVTDLEFDPSNPDILYAAAYQRRRQTWALLAGGPKSGIYKSVDGGESWERKKTGLPKGHMGKIGLAVTPANPEVVFATIEATESEKGFYRSLDKGESWEKRSSYTSGGTGPHYYQELEASPTDPDLVYQMDVFLHVSRDGGKTFDYLGTGREKHSDNHALWIDPDDGEHLIAGTDGGLYETFDEGSTWRHFPNLPISQFYKLGLDNAEPFYNIVGGAQDLGTLIGPSRTKNTEGIRNQDWYVPLGADGYESVFDPKDPNIAYMEIQQGLLYRLDRRSEEVLNIQPQAAPNDPPERWNWDSPLLISPHNSNRLYFGSQRLWRSNDQGNSWTPISGDLTTNTNRYELETIGRVWSTDALYDTGAMSKYATLTAISESPKVEGLLYTGSDDGLVQVSEDGGRNWRKSGALPKVPPRSFINDVEASGHDANTVFVVADAHKFGNYAPYLFMSTDRGRSWRSIAGDLPMGTIVWVVKQDHQDENLLFIGTEYGLYFSPNKGSNWIKLDAGVPTIAFRDLELHPRDNDLVGATFGRGFYVFDDYTALRALATAIGAKTNTLFSVRDAWWYVPNEPLQAKGMPSQGSTSFAAENPPFGAVFTYYLAELPQTAKAQRQDTEKALRNQNASIPFPGWDALRDELTEPEPQVLLLVRNENGDPVRWIKGTAKEGLHRSNWDLKLPAPDPVDLSVPAFQPPWAGDPEGPLAALGRYTVELFIAHDGQLTSQGTPESFMVKPVPTAAADTDFEAVAAFQEKTNTLARQISSASEKLGEARDRIKHMKAALLETPKASPELFARLKTLEDGLAALRLRLSGDPIRQKFNEATAPSISGRVGQVAYGHWGTRQPPTATLERNIALAETDFENFKGDLKAYWNSLEGYEAALETAGAPYTPGRKF
ncbi:glycosyl hydrolase [Flavobacteriaceae bacterium TP-CH-4]|uniref:Glycosyl hydrolase n=1 Tax=Pelagihabitans pacificus TaxID=2696054 RepID=A0A967E867_9FLAO|nr:glycosyl hydrolase [Pelagihabitans pacificus]NHF61350.1 glycosyl hydrolase [Pelagihabitans pacificus]